MEKEQIIAEARRRYTKGDTIKSAHQGDIVRHDGIGTYDADAEILWNEEKGRHCGWLYDSGKWAEIVPPKPIDNYSII